MRYDDRWIVNTNAPEAQSHGVYANYQHVNIAPDLSIAENYYLGQPRVTKLRAVDWRKWRMTARRLLINLRWAMETPDKNQEAAIAIRAGHGDHQQISVNDDIRMVIFDRAHGIARMKKWRCCSASSRVKESSVSIIYISHRLEKSWISATA